MNGALWATIDGLDLWFPDYIRLREYVLRKRAHNHRALVSRVWYGG